MTGRLKWYYSRLSTMNPGELLFRGRQIGQRMTEQIFTPTPEYDDAAIHKTGLQFSFTGLKTADTFTIFGKPLDITQPIDFHKDIFSGKNFPDSFSKSIDIRSDRFGSAKVVWEVNRLQFLVPLLIEYKKTGDKSKLDLFVSILEAWDEQNPYLKGLNWYSNIEVNLRLINWYWCWTILEGDTAWQDNEKYAFFRANTWLPLIYKHCHYSAKNPSYFSSANNHLIAEYTGLFLASTLWKFKETDKWLKRSLAGLEREIVLQHSENGVNKEEAAAYIQFTTDFFLLAYVAGQHHGISFSGQYVDRLTAICSYIHNFLDINGNIPRYGDDDDGRVILPDGDMQTNNFISILNTGTVLFNKPEWKRANADWDVKSQLLTTHIHGKKKWEKIGAIQQLRGSAFYTEEGHFILRKRTGDDKEIYCHFDAAPLGYLSIAAHGHADALSFILHVNGCPFFVDPGTYSYHTHSDWRKYFTGTLAHNTIAIDKTDQATLAGPTLWLNHFKSKVLSAVSAAEKDIVTATHNGYAEKNISHTRTISLNRASNTIELTDQIEAGQDNYLVNMPLHLHPAVSVEMKSASTFLLKHTGTSAIIEVSFDPILAITKIEATNTDTMGWYSAAFMKKEPSSLLMGEYAATEKKLDLQTTIRIVNL
jgi:hypothetical protein